MPKRSERSVRTVKAALETGISRRRSKEVSLAVPPPTPYLIGEERSTPDASGAIGVTGTQNVWGFISGEDYNPDLDGYPMFAKYDQMRRSDAQVAASLMQIKLPLKAARHAIKAASDDAQDQAIADFVTEALLSDGAFARPFSQALDNMLLRFDFGCSAEEIVWAVGESGELRFQDVAPRLPRTFYRWILDPATRKLAALQQFAPNINGAWGTFDIPGPAQGAKNRLVLHTHQREGDNYYGRSVLRAAYPNYFWKQQLYRIDAVKHDRLGAGIFIAELTADYKATVAPLEDIKQTLQGLRSHHQAYAIQPVGVKYGLLVPQAGGTGDPTDIMKSVEHHNQMIAQNVLQQFSTQGQQRHGSFGAAKVNSEAFFDALEGASEELATEITQGAIKPLCDANFNMKGRGYPKFTFADIATADSAAISEYVSKLTTSGNWTPDDDSETWLRELVDAPDLPEHMKGRERHGPVTVATPLSGQPSQPAPAKGKGKATGARQVPSNNGTHETPVQAASRTAYLENGRSFGRTPTDLERRIFDLHGVPSALEEQQAALVRQMGAIRREQLTILAARIAQKDARSTPAFTDIRHQHIKMPKIAALTQVIRAAQTIALDYGRQTVREELERQGAAVPTALASKTAAATRRTVKSTLVSSAQITARKQAGAWQARIMDDALRLRRTGIDSKDLEARIVEDLLDEVESGAKRDAAAEINEAFGLGRSNAAVEWGDLIDTAVYSAILDANTCETCEALDGEEFAVDSAEYEENLPPNANCSGGDSCRCVYLYLSAAPDEA